MDNPILRRSARGSIVNLIALFVVFAILMGLIGSGLINSYYEGIIMLICINIILAVSLNIVTGFLGQIALGHAGFMSVGAYTAGLFVKSTESLPGELRFLVSLIFGGLVAAVLGIIVGVPALRLKGDYLAIITLGFGEIIRVIIENIGFTGGAQGLRGIPRLANFPTVFWVTVLVIGILFTFVRSRHGRAITTIREDDIASSSSGIPNTYYKVLAFTTSAFFAGVAGAIYAQYYGVLSARAFNFSRSIDILVYVVLGGMGSLTGSILAAGVLTILPELLRSVADYRMLAYAVALILIMIFKPSGMLGRYEFSLIRALQWLRAKVRGNAVKEGGSGHGK